MKKIILCVVLLFTIFQCTVIQIFAEDESIVSFTAETPVITLAPSGITADVGAYFWLAANGNVSDGGTISYQWYISDTEDIADIKPIYSLQYPFYGRQNTFTPDQIEGTKYYCVEIINTLEKNGETTTASIFSELTAVTFNAAAESDNETETSSTNPIEETSTETSIDSSAEKSIETTTDTANSERDTETVNETTVETYQNTDSSTVTDIEKTDIINKNENDNIEKFNLSFVIIVALSVLLLIAIFIIIVLLIRLKSYK